MSAVDYNNFRRRINFAGKKRAYAYVSALVMTT